MGYLKEKYTKEYFTGKDDKGQSVGYGATLSYDEKGEFILREHDRKILNQINFKGKNVLGLGIGRGEELLYAVDKGAISCLGVDFSEDAINIARTIIKRKKINSIKLENNDALEFLNNFTKKNNYRKFDVVIMFDFVEHVPRNELSKIINKLKKVIEDNGIVAINTPSYKYDNDVIKNGYDKRNTINCTDTSDLCDSTAGMHCNKYTVISLQLFMEKLGLINVTEMHYFIVNKNIPYFSNISYAERWGVLFEKGYPVKNVYVDDLIEHPYTDAPLLKWKKFSSGDLRDLSLYTTDSYSSIAYKDGKIDSDIFTDSIFTKPRNNLVVFDIGAFVGADSLVFAKKIDKGGKVIAFEPNPYNRNRMFINLSRNNALRERIRVFPYALSESSGTIMMNISPNIDSGHSTTSRISGSHSKISDNSLPEGFFGSKVRVIKLDEFVEENEIKPDIIKVDIEGAEHMMLQGALKTLTKFHPTLFIEIHSEYCAVACLRVLMPLSYDISVINEEEDNRIMIKAVYKKINGNDKKNTAGMNLNNEVKLINEDNRRLRSSVDRNKKLNAKLTKQISESKKLNLKYSLENEHLREECARIEAKLKGIIESKSIRYTNVIKRTLRKKIIE